MPNSQGVLDLELPAIKPVAVAANARDIRAEFGTFKDSLRAPVHRWFTYPAGFSFKAVEEAFKIYDLQAGMTLYDPFAGTATTSIVAKQNGVHSFGVEAHPFVAFVARTKLFWEFDFSTLQSEIDALIQTIRERFMESEVDEAELVEAFPELVRKCYQTEKLGKLWTCRQAIIGLAPSPFRNLAKLALTNLLRALADVETGWPYIAPGKPKTSSPDVFQGLRDQLYMMAGDVATIARSSVAGAKTRLIEGDARARHDLIDRDSVDLSFTSPPYLNNYDYADRTRLETYFWGEAKTWSDITKNVRTRLIMSATTQANRGDFDEAQPLIADLHSVVPQMAHELKGKVAELSAMRLVKGGKKSYDIMVAGYFNDMLPMMREAYRVLKPGAAFVLIMGDSAPYGVHIPTDIYLGEIGCAIGFKRYEIEDLRVRGGKWKNNPQRHNVVLKESILTLFK